MQPNQELYPWLSAAVIAWGLLDCFYGYRIFRIMLAVSGAVAGALVGQAAVVALALGPNWPVPAMVVGALLGLAVVYWLFLAAVFVTGFAFGLSLGVLVLSHFHPMVALLSGCVIGVVAGLLALKLQQPLIMLSTALLGAFRAVVALAFFTAGLDWASCIRKPAQIPALLDHHAWMFPSILVLAAAGALAQFGIGNGGGKPAPADKKSARKPSEKKA